MTGAAWAAGLLALAACVLDIRTRRIPNALTFGAALAAFLFHGLFSGITGFGLSVAGWAVGLALFLPLFFLRGMGGGDLKLLAAIGAWLGPGTVIWVGLWSAVAGGVFALVVALARGYTKQAFRHVWGLLSYWSVMGMRPNPALTLESAPQSRLPYAVPMAAGLGLALWLR